MSTNVHHGGLIEDDQIRFEGMLQSPLEPVGLGIELQDAMNGASLEPRAFGEPLGGSSGRGTQQHLYPLGAQDAQEAINHRGLPHPGPAGDHGDLAIHGLGDGGPLRWRQHESRLLLHPGDGLIGIDPAPRRGAGEQCLQALCNSDLGTVERCEKEAGLPFDCLLDEVFLHQFRRDGLLDGRCRDFEQLL